MASIYAVHDVDTTSDHYARVVLEMKRRGAPIIRAIWHAGHGVWIAIEGSHRLRAARQLGLCPRIHDVTGRRTVLHDWDDFKSPADLTDMDDAWLLALVDTTRLNVEAVRFYFSDDDVPRGTVGYEEVVRLRPDK